MAQPARKLENDGRTENVQKKVKINAHVLFKNTTVLRHLYLVMSRTLVSGSSFKILACVRLQKLQTISHFGKEAERKSLSEGQHFLTTDPNSAKAPRKEY